MHRMNPRRALTTSAVLTALIVPSSTGTGGDDPRPRDPTPAPSASKGKASPDGGCACAKTTAKARYARSAASYALPDVTLVERSGEAVALKAALDHDGPVLLQFAFTSCPTICPALTGTFAAAQGKLAGDPGRPLMVTISIDPEHDTPARLRQYAKSYGAGPRWRFYTGKAEEIETVLKAFEAYRGNKMRHEPLTFLRPSCEAPWVRLTGLMSAEELVAEYRTTVKK